MMNVPMLVTEQNAKSLGKTISEFDISGAKGPFAKMQFNMCTPEVSIDLSCPIITLMLDIHLNVVYCFQISKQIAILCNGQRPESIVLIGIETHVCVENSAIDLREQGYEVHTVADCCSSRTQEDRLLALEVRCTIDLSIRSIYTCCPPLNLSKYFFFTENARHRLSYNYF